MQGYFIMQWLCHAIYRDGTVAPHCEKWKKKRYDPFATSLAIIYSCAQMMHGYMRFPLSSLIRYIHDILAKNSNSLEESPPL